MQQRPNGLSVTRLACEILAAISGHVTIYLKTEQLSTSDGKLSVQDSGANFFECLGKTRGVWCMPVAYGILSCGGLEFFHKELTFPTSLMHDMEKGRKIPMNTITANQSQ